MCTLLEVPERHEIPDPAACCDKTLVVTADFLMTALLRRSPAVLRAKWQGKEVRWLIEAADFDETCLYQSEMGGDFRGLLARFGHHYMDGQLYGGHIRRLLAQNARRYLCEFAMSNQAKTGFWIQICVHEVAATRDDTEPTTNR